MIDERLTGLGSSGWNELESSNRQFRAFVHATENVSKHDGVGFVLPTVTEPDAIKLFAVTEAPVPQELTEAVAVYGIAIRLCKLTVLPLPVRPVPAIENPPLGDADDDSGTTADGETPAASPSTAGSSDTWIPAQLKLLEDVNVTDGIVVVIGW